MEQRTHAALEAIAAYYRADHRALPWRENKDPYRVWLSEIMLQQTRVEAVIPYYHRFLSALPTVEALAEADDDLLYKCWEGLGYYSRARNLRLAARQIVAEGFPTTEDGWLSLPGVGPYTAGAVCGIVYGLPVPAVDGNVLRICARLTACREDVTHTAVKRRFTDILRRAYPTGERAGEVTQGFMELGQRLCLPNGAPHCEACPLSSLCLAHGQGITEEIPVRPVKKQRKICKMTVLLCHRRGAFALRRRPNEGLLAGLWEFPNAEGHLTADEAARATEALGLIPTALIALPDAKHIFTHIEWHMQGYLIDCEGDPPDLCFATAEQMRRAYPIATAFGAYKNYILSQNQP